MLPFEWMKSVFACEKRGKNREPKSTFKHRELPANLKLLDCETTKETTKNMGQIRKWFMRRFTLLPGGCVLDPRVTLRVNVYMQEIVKATANATAMRSIMAYSNFTLCACRRDSCRGPGGLTWVRCNSSTFGQGQAVWGWTKWSQMDFSCCPGIFRSSPEFFAFAMPSRPLVQVSKDLLCTLIKNREK